jgi:hypothetical protein
VQWARVRCKAARCAIPVWMTDADVCARVSLGPPTISLAALAELREFLDSWFRDQRHTGEPAGVQAAPDPGSLRPDSHGATESPWEAPE